MAKKVTTGFGLSLTDYEVRDDAMERLYNAISSKKAQKLFSGWKKTAPNLPLEKYLEVSLRVESIEKVLADAINDNCFGGNKIVIGYDNAIFVPVGLPTFPKDRWRFPLEEDARKILVSYARICFKGISKNDISYKMFTCR